MSEFFNYSTNNNQYKMEFPLWPDMNKNSEWSHKLIKTKQDNDDNYWSSMREVLKHDFETLHKEYLKSWASVMSVPLMSNSKHTDYIRLSLADAARDPIIANAITEPMIGITQELFNSFYKVFSDNNYSMNRMQHYGHLKMCGFDSKSLSKMNTIIELGGGLGEMAHIIYQLGFKGDYYIYDFEELGSIQKYIHTEAGLDKVHHISSLDDFPKESDLTIATWSLTEMPFDLRKQILGKLTADQDYLIAYSKKIFGYDNEKWITENFMNSNANFIDIPFMPWDGGSKYLTIKK